MGRKTTLFLAAALGLGMATALHAQALDLAQPGQWDIDYRSVKSAHEKFLEGRPSRQARLQALRDIVRASPYGERGLKHIFKNFEGAHAIDPRIQGVEQSVRLLTSASKQQQKGYMRELTYASGFHNAPAFKLEAMNELRTRPWGNTDADLVTTHRATGQRVRIEVKDVSLDSQQRNLAKLKAQIDKMAAERLLTGELQYWVNRREVLPAIRDYALQRGVLVEGQVKTGATGRGVALKQLQRQIHHSALQIDRGRQFTAAAGLVFGPMLIADGLDEFGVLWDIKATGGTWSDADRWLALQRTLDIAGGTGLTVYGSTYAVSRFAGTPTQGTAFRAGRIAGAGGVVLIGAAQAVSVYRYARGDITGREFWTAQGVNAGAFAITRAGSWLGGLGGTAFGPGGTTAGVLVGSTIGALVGVPIASRVAELIYVLTQREYDLLFGEKLYAKYGVL